MLMLKFTFTFLFTFMNIIVPDKASYIRGWIQMVLAPNDLFSWNNRYNKYIEYNITDTFTCFFLAMHTPYSVHAGILKPWRGRLPWLPAVFSFYHVLFLPLSGLNWRSLFPPWGSGPPFPQNGAPIHRVRAHSLPGIRNNHNEHVHEHIHGHDMDTDMDRDTDTNRDTDWDKYTNTWPFRSEKLSKLR
jgi:hypothetical protein